MWYSVIRKWKLPEEWRNEKIFWATGMVGRKPTFKCSNEGLRKLLGNFYTFGKVLDGQVCLKNMEKVYFK